MAHMALLGWLMLQPPHPHLSAITFEQPVEMIFETLAESAPDGPPPAAAPNLPSEPAAPVPPDPVPQALAMPSPAQAPSEPTPEPIEPPAPAPEPIQPTPAPSAMTPHSAPLPRPKPALARPSRPAMPAVPAPGVSQAGPATQAAPSPVARAPAAPLVAVAVTTDPGWRTALGNWLAAHKRYPERARQRGDEGTVGIRFTVDAGGRVLDVAVVRSSGSILLDDAARDMLAGQRVPPFPASMTLAQTTLPVDIRFQLEQ